MMNKLEVTGLGKKFFRNWVFRNLSFTAEAGTPLLITGQNGSGKSTLIRILAGQLTPDEGQARLILGGKEIPAEHMYRQVSWTGPYMDLFPDLSLKETIRLHFKFRENLLKGEAEILHLLQLEKYADRPLKVLSSGMMARLKNALAVFSRSGILILDEPTGTLDQANTEKLFGWLASGMTERIVIFVSNDSRDFGEFSRCLDLSAKQ